MFVEKKLGDDTTGHDLNHIKRVEKLAVTIAEEEQMSEAEITVIRAAVLLHDVIDEKLTDDVAVAKQEVLEVLQQSGASEEEIALIRDTIENMSYSKNLKEKYELTKVGKIVQDADRLDAIGAIGIARTFYYGGSKGHAMYDDSQPFDPEELDEAAYRTSTNVVNHFYEKLLRLESLMNTEAGKKLARERTLFMEAFLKQLELEIRGEK
ncbi:HD domain-containing protein [Jeotgalibaca sp. A122]|uniref:HD domain-containing protein n=1 Tax=Jeotgalibaca sp. A122 TaxID=3457322 RepID=UPI003FD11222